MAITEDKSSNPPGRCNSPELYDHNNTVSGHSRQKWTITERNVKFTMIVKHFRISFTERNRISRQKTNKYIEDVNILMNKLDVY